MTNRAGAIDRTLAGAFASVILMVAALFFPFLELSVAGLHRHASVLDAALAFSSGLIAPLSVAIALLIVVIPLLRAPRSPTPCCRCASAARRRRGAERAFRLAAQLKPWSMAEVFIIGVVVALVKVGGMASISLGPAFWAMACLVLLVIYEGTSLCEWTVWQTLERTPPVLTARARAGLIGCRTCGKVSPAAAGACPRCGARAAQPHARAACSGSGPGWPSG